MLCALGTEHLPRCSHMDAINHVSGLFSAKTNPKKLPELLIKPELSRPPSNECAEQARREEVRREGREAKISDPA